MIEHVYVNANWYIEEINIEISMDATVLEAKKLFAAKMSVVGDERPPEDMQLYKDCPIYSCGTTQEQPMSDDRTLSSYGIHEGEHVKMIPRPGSV